MDRSFPVEVTREGVRFFCKNEEQLTLFLAEGYAEVSAPAPVTAKKTKKKTSE